MKRIIPLSLLALAALTSSTRAQQFEPAIEAPKGFVPPANQGQQSQFPPLTELKYEADRWTDEQELNRLHVLLVADSNDQQGQTFNRNLETMKSLLTANIPADRLSVTVLTGDDVTPAKMLEYFQNLQSDRNDAIFYYYSGHGGMDQSRQFTPLWARGQYTGSSAGCLYRADLYSAMRKKMAGLTLIITDCCSSDSGAALPAPAQISGAPAPTTPGDPQVIQNVARSLFLKHRGVVDITSALPHHFSWSNGVTVGLTPAIACVFNSPQQFLTSGGNGLVTWDDFHKQVNMQLPMMLVQQNANFMQLTSSFRHAPLGEKMWINEIEGIGQSSWTFQNLGDSYKAAENGLGNATGTAVLKGYKLHIDFSAPDGSQGAYDVDIQSGEGQCTLTAGPLAGQTHRVTFSEGIYEVGKGLHKIV